MRRELQMDGERAFGARGGPLAEGALGERAADGCAAARVPARTDAHRYARTVGARMAAEAGHRRRYGYGDGL